jgi:hypothetical protein
VKSAGPVVSLQAAPPLCVLFAHTQLPQLQTPLLLHTSPLTPTGHGAQVAPAGGGLVVIKQMASA